MKIVTLGAIGAYPKNTHLNTSFLIEINSTYILFDCPDGSQVILSQLRYSLTDLNCIFISHLHGDHVCGLIALLNTLSQLNKGLQNPRSLLICGPVGIKQFIIKSLEMIGVVVADKNLPLIFCEMDFYDTLETKTLKIPYNQIPIKTNNDKNNNNILNTNKCKLNFTLEAVLLNHANVPTFGLLIKEGASTGSSVNLMLGPEELEIAGGDVLGICEMKSVKRFADSTPGDVTKNCGKIKKVLICSDNKLSPLENEKQKNIINNLRKVANGVDLLVHECTYVEPTPEKNHSWSKDVIDFAISTNVHRLIINHYSPMLLTGSQQKSIIDVNLSELVFENSKTNFSHSSEINKTNTNMSKDKKSKLSIDDFVSEALKYDKNGKLFVSGAIEGGCVTIECDNN